MALITRTPYNFKRAVSLLLAVALLSCSATFAQTISDRESQLLTAVKSPSAVEREQAIAQLGLVDNPHQEIVNVICAALNDSKDGVKSAALRAIYRFGTQAVDATDAVLAILDDESATIILRSLAPATLGRIAPTSSKVVERLVAVVDDASLLMRVSSVEALGQIALSHPESRPLIVKMSNTVLQSLLEKDQPLILRAKSLQVLAALEPISTASINNLSDFAIKHLDTPTINVSEGVLTRQYAIVADAVDTLISVGAEKEALQVLIQQLRSGNKETQAIAALTLGKLGDKANTAFDDLLKILKTETDSTDDVWLKTSVMRSLVQIRPQSEELLIQLKKLKANRNQQLSSAAERYLAMVKMVSDQNKK